MILDLTAGICKNEAYNAFKFPGGELHFLLSGDTMIELSTLKSSESLQVWTRLKTSDDIILLAIVLDTIAKDFKTKVVVNIPYMPYQQADRDFGDGECFSLKTITNIMNALPHNKYVIFDPHSDITPALLKKVEIVDNSDFITEVITSLGTPDKELDLCVLSPDAGAYKKIFKLCKNIQFLGDIECANKYRDTKNGNIDSIRISRPDFNGKNVLVIDDICMGGRTFVELAKALADKNIGKLYLAVSHGIFSNGLGELSTYYDKIFTTSSRVTEEDAKRLLKTIEDNPNAKKDTELTVFNLMTK